jgi:hypothetical protein
MKEIWHSDTRRKGKEKEKTPRRKNASYTLLCITTVAYQISEHRDGLGQLGNFVARNPQNLPHSKNKKSQKGNLGEK